MSFPTIPNITPSINITCEEVVNLLLASIAFEELGLAHLINSEAEKIQFILGTLPGQTTSAPPSFGALISINRSVESILRTAIKQQMLLQFKLEDVLDITCSTTTPVPTTTTTTTTSTTMTTTTVSETTTTTTVSETTTTTTTTTTTSTTTTTTTTTAAVLFFQNTATVTGEALGSAIPTVQDSEVAVFNSTSNPNVTGKNLVTTATFQGQLPDIVIGGVNLGRLPDYLMFFDNGSTHINWHGSSHGYVGDVAVNGLVANLQSSGTNVPYAGTIFTNNNTLQPWQTNIIDPNTAPNVPVTQAFGVLNDTTRIANLQNNLAAAFAQINALPDNSNTLPAPFNAFNGDPLLLNGLNTQDGIPQVYVLDIFTPNAGTDWKISTPINITGDAGDVFIFRWDTDRNFTNGYQGQVDFESGGAIVPLGGLKASNFIHVAGDIHAAGGSAFLDPSYPPGPRYNDGTGPLIENGSDWAVAGAYTGGFFTGYWLTTGVPGTGVTTTGGNLRIVGGWYTTTTAVDMGSGWSGVHISPNQATETPAINLVKEVSVDNGATFVISNNLPGPTLPPGQKPWYRYTITNTGPITITNITVTDNVIGLIGTLPSLAPGASMQWVYQTT